MKTRFLLFFFTVCVLFLSPFAFANEKRLLSIDEVMQMAEQNSPRLSASRFRELAARKSVDIARANYFPTLNLEAIDSAGFTGSSGLLGMGGLVGSPYRSGYAVGAVIEQIIWDFGRTYYDVEASKQEVLFSKQDTRVSLYQVKQLALQTFYECAFFKTQSKIWGKLSHESHIITKEAQRFVDTGQVSIVDRYLSKAQTEEAQTAHAFFSEQEKKSIQVLAVIMGIPDNNFICPLLANILTHSLDPDLGSESSPLLARAMVDEKVANARFQQKKADFYPKIVAIASAGVMESSTLVQKKDYSAGIGVILPIIDFRASGEIQRAKALLFAKKQEIEAEKQYLDEMNGKYDEIIQSSKVRLQHLQLELNLANKAFNTAKKRYFALEGELIDLREAFRNLARVETQILDTRAKMLIAAGSKALLNGGGG